MRGQLLINYDSNCRFDDNLRRLRRLEQAFEVFTATRSACYLKVDDSDVKCAAPEAIAPPRQPATRATE